MSATVIIGLDIDQPLILDMRESSNTAQDFCTFVAMVINKGLLKPGDNFIYDNAAVHIAEDTWLEVSGMLEAAQVTSIPLPKYSPELNPIEKCFGVVKHYLRYNRCTTQPLLLEILKGFALITPTLVATEFLACLDTASRPMVIPPEMGE